jgi:hypothetical protein
LLRGCARQRARATGFFLVLLFLPLFRALVFFSFVFARPSRRRPRSEKGVTRSAACSGFFLFAIGTSLNKRDHLRVCVLPAGGRKSVVCVFAFRLVQFGRRCSGMRQMRMCVCVCVCVFFNTICEAVHAYPWQL